MACESKTQRFQRKLFCLLPVIDQLDSFSVVWIVNVATLTKNATFSQNNTTGVKMSGPYTLPVFPHRTNEASNENLLKNNILTEISGKRRVNNFN